MKKNIVITGGSGVLCSIMAKDLAKKGANIILLDRDKEKSLELKSIIEKEGGKALCYKVDVLEENTLIEAREKMESEVGFCDILINGAGGNNPKATTTKDYFSVGDIENDEVRSFFDLEVDGFNFVYGLNITGTVLPTQIFAKNMIGRSGCSILNISSMNAYTPLTRIPAYSSAKAGISNFTQWLAVHFSKVGIRVNAIAPGFFLTAQNHNLLIDENDNYTDRAKKIINATPMEKFGEPEDLLGAVEFLVDEKKSGFVTGVIIPIDGGFSAYSGV